METHSGILAWETPQAEAPGRLLFTGLQRIGHDLVTQQQQQILLCKNNFLGFIFSVCFLI